MKRNIFITGALLAGVGVGIGAFGAHGLEALLTSYGRVDTFETAVKYQFYHGLALLILGVSPDHIISEKNVKTPSVLLYLGTIIFSVSLYTLCLSNIRWLGAITPIGGTLMIIGWFLLAFNAYKQKKLP